MLPIRTRWFALPAVVLLLSTSANQSGAQLAAGRGSLDIPAGLPLECKVPEPTARERAATTPAPNPMLRRRFGIPRDDGLQIPGLPPVPQREIDVAWDSTGRVRMLIDRAQLPRASSAIVLVTFMPDGAVRGYHTFVTVDSARIVEAARSGTILDPKEMLASNPPVQREVTPEELVRIRELAAWLWPRRCNASR
ncbi:MAG: hypothetical protein V4617_15910 [Gemmatimonadota bacterium]